VRRDGKKSSRLVFSEPKNASRHKVGLSSEPHWWSLDTSNVVNRSYKPLLRRAELPNIRYHDLRHTCATLLARKNVNPKVVQDTLGHANLNMTLGVYSPVQAAMKDARPLRLWTAHFPKRVSVRLV
jgi:integrase